MKYGEVAFRVIAFIWIFLTLPYTITLSFCVIYTLIGIAKAPLIKIDNNKSEDKEDEI